MKGQKERTRMGRISVLLAAAMLIGLIGGVPIVASGYWSALEAWDTSEDGTFVKVGDIGSPSTVDYSGTVDFNTVAFDMKFGSTWEWSDSNVGLVVYANESDYYFLELNPGQKYVRVRRFDPEAWLGIANDTVNFAMDEWINVKFVFGNDHLEVIINGESMITVSDTGDDDLTTPAGLSISTWGAMPHIKNIKTSNTKYEEVKPVKNEWNPDAGWVETTEGDERVMTNTSWLSTIKRTSEDKGSYNTFSFDFRLNSAITASDANVSASIKVGDSDSWLFEYNPAPGRSYLRLRWYPESSAEGTELALKQITVADPDEWVNLKVVFMENYLLFYIDGELMLTHFDTNGADMSTTLATVSTWNTGVSVKNLSVSNSEKDLAAAGYVDLEFNDENAIESFKASDGSLSYSDGQLVMKLDGSSPTLTSPRIDVTPGNIYSMYLPVRNTVLLRMKNESNASKIRVEYTTSVDGEWDDAKSKLFDIEPNSEYTTYYLNLSDTDGADGYLRGFRFVFFGAESGMISIDAITFEREDEIYRYAGEIISCIGDPDTMSATVVGKADAAYEGKTVTLWASDYRNYDDDLRGPYNLEAYYNGNANYLNIRDGMDKLGEAIVVNGQFELTFSLKKTGNKTHLSTPFIAEIDGVKVAKSFFVENYGDFNDDPDRFEVEIKKEVSVTDFGAKGDGFTDDTEAFQAAIDAVSAAGGGRVVVPGDESTYGRRYVITHIELCSNLEFVVEEGAVIWQSQRKDELNKTVPVGERGFDSVSYGHNVDIDGLVWCHAFSTVNKPMIYANGCENLRITGGGIIRMNDAGGEKEDPLYFAGDPGLAVGQESRAQQIPIMIYNCSHIDVTDITIMRSNGWHLVCPYSYDLYIGNVKEKEAANVTADGFSAPMSQKVTIDRCFTYTSDDAVALTVYYEDGRGQFFYPSITDGEDHSIDGLEIRHSYLFGGHGISFIPWGSESPNEHDYEIRNIEIYDCIIGGHRSSSCWADNPFYGKSALDHYTQSEVDYSPIKDLYFHDNTYYNPFYWEMYGVPVWATNFIMADKITGTIYSSSVFKNGNFDRNAHNGNGFHDESGYTSGLSYWSERPGEGGAVGTIKVGTKNATFVDTGEAFVQDDYAGYIDGAGELFQGLYLKGGKYSFTIDTKLTSGVAKMIARDAVSGEIIAEKSVDLSENFAQGELLFKLDTAATVQLGVMLEDGKVLIDNASVNSYSGEIPVEPVDPIDPVDPVEPDEPTEPPKTGVAFGAFFVMMCALLTAVATIIRKRRYIQ